MNKKILVCDDQELIREILSTYLKSHGFHVETAENGNECLKQLSKHDFDGIILDVKMPDIEGASLISKVKETVDQSRIILISGHDFESPGFLFFRKPFSLHSILEKLKSLVLQPASKVLVVDDQDFLREMLSDYLKDKGFEISQAKNGKEALQLSRERAFDGILMDVRMPEVDGLAALKQMQASGVKAPVILMSGFGDVRSVEDAKALGAFDFLPKPFKLEAASLALAGIG